MSNDEEMSLENRNQWISSHEHLGKMNNRIVYHNQQNIQMNLLHYNHVLRLVHIQHVHQIKQWIHIEEWIIILQIDIEKRGLVRLFRRLSLLNCFYSTFFLMICRKLERNLCYLYFILWQMMCDDFYHHYKIIVLLYFLFF